MARASSNLRRLRLQSGLSQNRLSALAELDRSTISSAEAGREVSEVTIAKLKVALEKELGRDLTDSELLGDADEFHATSPPGGISPLPVLAAEIPEQSDTIRFALSENNRIGLVPTRTDENDYETINALRSELLAAKGPIDTLRKRYDSNPNTPQAEIFAPLCARYEEELSQEPEKINYAVLYARGARFFAARTTAQRNVASGEWPDPDAKEEDAINAVCDLHGPLIMASFAGRKLVADAHIYETAPEEYRAEENLFSEFGIALSKEVELFEPETVSAIQDITMPIPDDPQPARSRGARLFLASSVLSVVVGGTAWFLAGGVGAAFLLQAAAIGTTGLAGGFLWEVAKKTDKFKLSTESLAKKADDKLDAAQRAALNKHRDLHARLSDLLESRKDLFDRISNLRPEFSWTKRVLSVSKQPQVNNQNPLSKPKIKKERHVLIIGSRGSGKSTIGEMLSSSLEIPFYVIERETESAASLTVSEIIERDGEPFLNKRQLEVFQRLRLSGRAVFEIPPNLATNREFWKALEPSDLTVWVDTPEDLLWQTRRHRADDFQLRTADPRGTLSKLVAQESEAFSQADVRLPYSYGSNISDLVERISERIKVD